jgi:uncharacterized protein (TIGR03032 family)
VSTGAVRESGRNIWRDADVAWRDPAQVVAQCRDIGPVSPESLRCEVRGEWWELLERLEACVVVSREYEHLMLALTVTADGPRRSFMTLPHPSGMVFDGDSDRLYVVSTRNPNQLFVLAPARGGELDPRGSRGALAPLSVSFLPGRLYLHGLALIDGGLHGSAAGINAIVRLGEAGSHETVWWPRSIEFDGCADFTRNYLQLNSIAAGDDLSSSFFSASAATPSRRRPGHRNFPVDRRGVIFSGLTREPVVWGLTRPHSARLHHGEVWVHDSGYGRVGTARDGRLETFAELPGWTRGLAFAEDVVFVGTSRVIPRFAHYAPGLDVRRSVCAIHALDAATAEVLGSISWPAGNQIFDICILPRTSTLGFPTVAGRRGTRALRSFFLSYEPPTDRAVDD